MSEDNRDPERVALCHLIWELDDIIRATRWVPNRVRVASRLASEIAQDPEPSKKVEAIRRKRGALSSP